MCNLCIGQHSTYFQLTEEEGLPDYKFYDMIEDQSGNIWFACNNGLFKYNGFDYKEYTNTQKKGSPVFNLTEDKKGRVWCVNLSGQIFYAEHDQLHFFFDISPYMSTEQLNDFEISGDYLYMASKAGILKIHTLTKVFRFINSYYSYHIAQYDQQLYTMFLKDGKKYVADLGQKTNYK